MTDPTTSWFDVRSLGAGYHLISEPGHVNCYLLTGRDSAMLFDSGMGIEPISNRVAAISDLPLLVVNSHAHLDHRGGNHELLTSASVRLQGIAAHPSGQHAPFDRQFLDCYATAMRSVVANHDRFRELDDELFFTATGLPRMRQLPDLTEWHPPAVAPTRSLDDGEWINLGGRRLQVLHTPGHAPDCLSLWDPDDRTILAGDTVLSAAHWLHGNDADLEQFVVSLDRLASLKARRVLVAHNLQYELPGQAIRCVAAAARAVLDGRALTRPGRDMLGFPATRSEHAGVVILSGASS